MTENMGAMDANAGRARLAFEGLAAVIADIPEDRIIKVNLPIPKLVGTVVAKFPAIRTLRPKIVEHLPTFNLQRFDNLENIALALFYAQGAYLTASRSKVALQQLGARGVKLRRVLLSDADTQAIREIFDEGVLSAIRLGSGYRDLGEDLIALVHLYRSRWEDVRHTTGISQAELAEAESLAPLLVIGAEQRELPEEIRNKAVEQRERVFALMIEAYNDVRRAALYLCPTEKEADAIAPSLYAGRGSRPGSAEEVEELPGDALTDNDTLPGEVPATAGGAATSAGNTTSASSTQGTQGPARTGSQMVGMPDSDPFTE